MLLDTNLLRVCVGGRKPLHADNLDHLAAVLGAHEHHVQCTHHRLCTSYTISRCAAPLHHQQIGYTCAPAAPPTDTLHLYKAVALTADMQLIHMPHVTVS